MSIRAIALTAAAIASLIAARVAVTLSPQVQHYATTAGIVLLGLIALTGIVVPLILRQPERPHRLTPTAQRPAEAPEPVASGTHPGGVR